MIWIFDYEVFAYNWILCAESLDGDKRVFVDDYEALQAFQKIENPLLCGFNVKRYDRYIHAAVLNDFTHEQIKGLNDFIIGGGNPWDIQGLRANFKCFDLMDDMQVGLSLKAIEGHLGMNIKESSVPFDIDRPLTEEEINEVVAYCQYDVTATKELLKLRKNYLQNKTYIGSLKGIPAEDALYMTNAKLTAAYLDAVPPAEPRNDERDYEYPLTLLRGFIPAEVIEFFDKFKETSNNDGKCGFSIGDCVVTVGIGGIHGSIDHYREKATDMRTIRNVDVGSYYPHLMTLEGYCSRNIPDPSVYAKMLDERMAAKKAGDKEKANALKLVCNTTYGAMLNQYNDLYDPLMGRSVCITGQLRLLELAMHLVRDCKTLKVIQMNTDGIMVSLDNTDLGTYYEICAEWERRTGQVLEEDLISEIIQKDVNGYIEIGVDGSRKIKGGYLVRGVAPAGAFNINNNATVIPQAIIAYFAENKPAEETIGECDDILSYQLIAKASGKYSHVWHIVDGYRTEVQRCNRVYAAKDITLGTLYKTSKETGNDIKIADLPDHCIIDNDNQLSIDSVDKEWYIRKAKRMINDFLGIEPPKKNTRKINALAKQALKILEGE